MSISKNTAKNTVTIVLGLQLPSEVKALPAMWETRVRSLGWEDPLEKEMAAHSSTLALRIPWREEPGRLQSTGSQRVGHDWFYSSPYLIRKEIRDNL